jgi:hypothetical protein
MMGVKMKWYSVMSGGVDILNKSKGKLHDAGFTVQLYSVNGWTTLEVWGDKRTLRQARAILAGVTYTWESK